MLISDTYKSYMEAQPMGVQNRIHKWAYMTSIQDQLLLLKGFLLGHFSLPEAAVFNTARPASQYW